MFQLDKFLRVYQEVDLPATQDNPTGDKVTIRVLSDLEMNARRDYALAESLRILEALKDPASEAYRMKVLPFMDATADSIVDLLAEGKIIELKTEAERLYSVSFVPTPEDPTLTDELDTEKRQQLHEAQVYKDRLEYIIKSLNAFRDKMGGLSREQLFKEVEYRAKQAYPDATFKTALFYYTIWCSVEKDGKKYWPNVEAVKQLPKTILDKLDGFYKELDSIDPWELSKSVPAG